MHHGKRPRPFEGPPTSPPLILILGWFLATSTSAQQCNYITDTCHYQFDGECDADVYCDVVSDCFDCDECRNFSYDCGLCVQAGCHWCPGDALCASSPIGELVWDLHPTRQPACRLETDWVQECTANANNVWTDPLYDSMTWMYDLIRVQDVWAQGITGTGVHVRVNDDGVDATHEEFVQNFDTANSCTSFLPTDYANDSHGTACASIIAGAKNNGVCASGLAPDVTLSACNGPDTLDGATEIFNTHLEVIDVISNSWGPLPCESTLERTRKLQQQSCPFDLNHPESPCNTCGTNAFSAALTPTCEEAITSYCSTTYENDPVACGEYLDLYVQCEFHSLSPTNEAGFAQVIAEGRGGLGPIITFAGGNDYKIGVDANGDGMVNSRYTIGVAAVGKDGLHASYSTTGAAILVAAPGGDDEALSNNIVANPGGGCHDITVGTSFATPVVSAVAALMLQANPNLGWRDVQGVLAISSQRVDFEDSSWYTNQAGISHSYKYGFGLIDASAAVAFAQTWENWDPEKQIMVESGVIDLAIPDNTASPNGAKSTLEVTPAMVLNATGIPNIAMESVVVYLDLKHGSRGNVQITLTSPQGTQSILAPSKRPENTILGTDQRWKLMTVRNWGENPIGNWTLEIADEEPGIIADCVNIPWEYQLDGEYYRCSNFGGITDCSSPSQVPFALQQGRFNDQTIFENCCACGGGLDAAAIDQRLSSWRMIAYGHLAPETPAPTSPAPTSPAPTVAVIQPTLAPTVGVRTCAFFNDTQLTADSGVLNNEIPDANVGTLVSKMSITEPRNITVDSIDVFLDLSHQSRGDLKVTLKTAGGTEVILAPGGRVAPQEPPSGEPWRFSTCAASGESPDGNWTLSILDINPGIQSQCVDYIWQATIDTNVYNCSSFANATDCSLVNQAAISTPFEGRTGLESCCACGGGVDMTAYTNVLRSWNMILYSQYETPMPTPQPTTTATVGSPGPIPPAANGTALPVANSTAAPVSAPSPQPTMGFTPAPAALSRAIVFTMAPNVTNAPFRTSATSSARGMRAAVRGCALLAIGMSMSVVAVLV